MAEVRFDVSVLDEGCLMYSFLSKSGRVANYGNPAKSLLFYILKQYDTAEVHVVLIILLSMIAVRSGLRLSMN